MKKKYIYIIGNSSIEITEDEIEKFRIAESTLMSLGFKVFNPLSFSKNSDKVLTTTAKKENLQQLFNCDAVYILPCVAISKDNLEIKIGILLDLLVIHGS